MPTNPPRSTAYAGLVIWLTLAAFGVGRAASVLGWPEAASISFACAWLVGCCGVPVVIGGVAEAVKAARGGTTEGGA